MVDKVSSNEPDDVNIDYSECGNLIYAEKYDEAIKWINDIKEKITKIIY